MNTRQVLGSVPMVLVLIAGTASSNPAAAYTAGEPVVESTLGERLRGYLRLELQPGEAPPESVALAPDELYEKMGLAAPEFTASLYQLHLRQRSELSWDIVIETQNGVREPIVQLVLEIKQGRMTQYREIALMIDPPGMPAPAAADSTQVGVSALGAIASSRIVKADSASDSSPATTPQTHRHHSRQHAIQKTSGAIDRTSRPATVPRVSLATISGNEAPASAGVATVIGHFRLDATFASMHAGLDPGVPADSKDASALAIVPDAKPAIAVANSEAGTSSTAVAAIPASPPALPAPANASVVSALPSLSGVDVSPRPSDRSIFVRLMGAMMLLLAGLIVWRTRRTALPPEQPTSSPEAAAPLSNPAAVLPLDAAPGRGPGRVTPIENAYAIRGSAPPPQRVVGE